MWCAQRLLNARAHTTVLFFDGVCVLCAKLCQIPHLTGYQGSATRWVLTETALLSFQPLWRSGERVLLRRRMSVRQSSGV